VQSIDTINIENVAVYPANYWLSVPPEASFMQIYMFTSEASPTLNAFAGDPDGSKLPESHGPWGPAGSIRSDQHPPHRFSRAKIEEAIKLIGFQLWRVKTPVKKKAARAAA
jgi:hypothetical protein